MTGPIRHASEPASNFDARLHAHSEAIAGQGTDVVMRHASTVYAEGVVAGLSLGVAALQRRERLIDYLRRWEAQLARCVEREYVR